ncbi:MAG: FAD-dependent oxidoreductase [Bacteroidales bacterium]|jgi:dihydrolipoamide dehydrogenase|nr:FAD-dependent oxidoreductase [Bacteroidales bacterium]MCK9499165.1 FAD-dependent oxidoreductase [Bacteroidales bacterium]MDY0314660.1 FAD-dependent oxidoreductase [Bacteroidales bacterium]NLB85624.1 FAD-dependent oxidoreductase [Bacteroidales bacterium]
MNYDLIIIGAGPAGYVSAIRAGQLGMKTLIVEKSKLGGMCLNWGCIPSKSLIESAKLFVKAKELKSYGIDGIDKNALSFNWKTAVRKAFATTTKLSKGVEFLLKKNGVETIIGNAEITSTNSISVNNQLIEAKNIIIATGSVPNSGGDSELRIDDFYNLEALPENIVFYGNGPVSVEFAQMAAMAGAKVQIFTQEDILVPQLDEYLLEFLKKKLKKENIQVINDESLIPENAVKVNARRRKAVLPNSKLEFKLNEKGFVETNENLETSIPGIFAIGDVNGKSAFAHSGSAQGLYVVNKLKGVKATYDLKKYPINIYSSPEIAQLGFTEQELKEQEIDYKISSFPLSANGKAIITSDTEGELRILSENKYGEVLGVQIIAANATDMIAEASAYMSLEATVYDLASTIHAHPTVSEIFLEAGLEAVDAAIHK